jgi:ubiquinone/menaquinone biosynthesis C-methylase UbiE
MDSTPPAAYWNHNVHHERFILAAVPPGCTAALEVGCGDGRMLRALAARCGEVTGIDSDARMISLARRNCAGERNVSLIERDFMAQPFSKESFDFACANTVLHHMDFPAALRALRDLVRPGGRIAVVGLGRDTFPADLPRALVASPVNRVLRAVHGEGGPGAPVKEPGLTWAQTRAAALEVLPGARYRRHLLWRYSLVWRKPGQRAPS